MVLRIGWFLGLDGFAGLDLVSGLDKDGGSFWIGSFFRFRIVRGSGQFHVGYGLTVHWYWINALSEVTIINFSPLPAYIY